MAKLIVVAVVDGSKLEQKMMIYSKGLQLPLQTIKAKGQ
jgi:hypothetical protein